MIHPKFKCSDRFALLDSYPAIQLGNDLLWMITIYIGQSELPS